jgi:hypothetical protein
MKIIKIGKKKQRTEQNRTDSDCLIPIIKEHPNLI